VVRFVVTPKGVISGVKAALVLAQPVSVYDSVENNVRAAIADPVTTGASA
jgi:hypothetical protein